VAAFAKKSSHIFLKLVFFGRLKGALALLAVDFRQEHKDK
jgi:hypothetical protein